MPSVVNELYMAFYCTFVPTTQVVLQHTHSFINTLMAEVSAHHTQLIMPHNIPILIHPHIQCTRRNSHHKQLWLHCLAAVASDRTIALPINAPSTSRATATQLSITDESTRKEDSTSNLSNNLPICDVFDHAARQLAVPLSPFSYPMFCYGPSCLTQTHKAIMYLQCIGVTVNYR